MWKEDSDRIGSLSTSILSIVVTVAAFKKYSNTTVVLWKCF